MTFVIHKDPSPQVVKEAVCRDGCGATIGYVPNDIKSVYCRDYDGSGDRYIYILCCICEKKIFIKG